MDYVEKHGIHSSNGSGYPNAKPTTKLPHNQLQDMKNEVDFCSSEG
jgi:hypothetical protein